MEHTIKVTDVRLKLKDGNGMKALCHIVINGMLAVNDIRIIQSQRGNLLVAMPSRKMPDGKFRDVCNPVNAEARFIIEKAVLDEYEKMTTLDYELLNLIS